MNPISLILSQQEAVVLIQLIDLAVKSGGIQVAESAVVLAKKIEDASKEAQTPQEPAKPAKPSPKS